MSAFRPALVIVLVVGFVACSSERPPSAPQIPTAPSVNRAPELTVGPVTPPLGIEGVTTFRLPVDVRDPDGDPVTLTMSGCPADPTTQAVQNGRVELTFKADRLCASSLKITATDTKGGAAEQSAAFQHTNLHGYRRLVIGEGYYAQPGFSVNLTQAETRITGTITDFSRSAHTGTTDPSDPGTIDGDGRFRLHFKIDRDDIVVAGQVQSADSNVLGDVLVASCRVVGGVYAGRSCQLWNSAMY